MLLKHYVRNWGRSPEQREPLSDASLLPKLSEVEPFLSAEQREIITSAQARLLRFRSPAMAMTMATMTMRNAKMIVPTDRDIGRQVVHTFNAAYSGKKTQCATLMSFSANVAVIQKGRGSETVPFTELEWGEPRPKVSPPLDDVQREMVLADIAFLKQQELENGDRAKWEADQAPRNVFNRIRIIPLRDGER